MRHFISFGQHALFAATCLAISSFALAEEDAAEPPSSTTLSGVEELTVTARRREEDLQSVPISITALTFEDLRIRDVYNLERLAQQTPGVSFGTTGSVSGTRVIIRGLAQQTRVGDEPNVANFIDGVYTPGFSGSEFFGFESLERIEVLKGPQSALYGRNSFAGAINYVTKKPTYEFEYGGRVTLGQDDREGLSAFVSGPLIDDTLAMRIDTGYNQTGGTHENTANGDQLNSTETRFVRWGTLWDANDRLRFNLALSYQEDDSNPAAVTMVADDDPQRVGQWFLASPFEFAAGGGGTIPQLMDGAIRNTSDRYWVDPRSYAGDREIWRVSLKFELDFENFQLIGLTGYQDREFDYLRDFSTCRRDVRAAVCDTVSPTAYGTFFGGPLAQAPIIGTILTGAAEDRDEFSQDLRLQSTGDGRLQWSTGIYYSTEDFEDQRQRLSDITLSNRDGTKFYALADPYNVQVDSTIDFRNDFFSVYGSLGYDISDTWNVVAETRYTREEKEADQFENNFPTGVPPTGKQEEDFDFLTPRFILNYTPTDDLLVYGSVAKGVKSGGFNPGSMAEPVFDEEKNWTYELGSKWTFLDGKARVNGAVYYIDWEDQQVTTIDPDNAQLPITVNVAESEIWGAELEGFYAPTEWLDLNIGAAIIDAEYKDGESATISAMKDCENLVIPCDAIFGPLSLTSGSLDGQNIVGTPEKMFNAGIQVNWPLFETQWDFMGRLDYSWNDKVYIDMANQGYVPSRETVNLRLGIRNDNWIVEGFCNNLTDDDTPLFALPPRDIMGVPHYAVVNRNERLCGIQISYRN
ncbi:MAG: TonB-dependent receptor [Gammaproteobacteria bacterium]|jgi:iron complex outermembrane receptor protein|nr:TonB-dependent receptor [Gammaproteobacteria bacterium]